MRGVDWEIEKIENKQLKKIFIALKTKKYKYHVREFNDTFEAKLVVEDKSSNVTALVWAFICGSK